MTGKKVFYSKSQGLKKIFWLSFSFLANHSSSVCKKITNHNAVEQNVSGNADPKTSLCLDPSVIQEAAKSDGITDPANPQHFAKSLTSVNNFINICVGSKITNGAQAEDGSCNPTPMGFLPAKNKMPAAKIVAPSAKTRIQRCQEFNITITVRNIQVGFFTAPDATYYLAPQQLNTKGVIKGHVHVVVQLVKPHEPFDSEIFTFFKGISDSAVRGKLSTTVTGGLPDGIYRVSTLVSAMNHQLASLPIAQRGAVDDAVYITVGTGVSAPGDDGSGQAAEAQCKKSPDTSSGIKGEGVGAGASNGIKGEGGGAGASTVDTRRQSKQQETSPVFLKGGGSAGRKTRKVCRRRRKRKV
ncbi:hypothetical protein O181_018667 [Austropuccinia psidii MF-1]|uniref:Uncharacterized protein n=1 Tax=Austropuccinia psidii MF-1 TaxID=1389203 RepID=A0A9Q3CA10_9BASI|nr:hypothetical protein [Austropuccinia psidii MF-1]